MAMVATTEKVLDFTARNMVKCCRSFERGITLKQGIVSVLVARRELRHFRLYEEEYGREHIKRIC